MIYNIARLMQLAGLIIVPVAIAGEVSGKMSLKDFLVLASVGGLLFLAGWVLQQKVKK
jgi:hypothetical protein